MIGSTPRLLAFCLLAMLSAAPAPAQSAGPGVEVKPDASEGELPARPSAKADPLDEVRRQLREQREEIDRLQAALREQMRIIGDLRARLDRAEGAAQSEGRTPVGAAPTTPTAGAQGVQGGQVEERVGRAEALAQRTSEALARQLGSITFSGDLRVRYEPFFGQINASPSGSGGESPVLGNPLSARHRFRLRARLAVRGRIGQQFDWGLRLATGSFPDVNSSNQTLTDFFSHKNFALDQAFISYRPANAPGLQLQGGKFPTPWTRTEMTFDDDINPEGFNQSYTREFKGSFVRQIALVAWQLPFLERASGFALGPGGRVDLEQSRRAGRDLALYGAQARARLEPFRSFALSLSAADLFYSGTQLITPVQFFGSQVQLPVTLTIPATGTTPAQVVTGVVSIPRDQFVSGNANLGLSSATTNAVNRDGRLASGFNLVDLIGRIDLSHSRRFPVTLLLNFVTNTQARDVTAAGPGGATIVQANREDNGYWAEAQVGKTEERGDWLFGYTFIRIEKDAVLTPFNYSDLVQNSDVRAQRFVVAYAADPRVTLSLTGIVSRRANGLLGPFNATPAGSLNRPTTRLQIDTVFRF